jgi:hypothetical protein
MDIKRKTCDIQTWGKNLIKVILVRHTSYNEDDLQ